MFTSDCKIPRPLGIANHDILDSQLKASSFQNDQERPSVARLNITAVHGKNTGGWTRKSDDTNPWLQVDFLKPHRIVGIETQGHSCFNTIQFD